MINIKDFISTVKNNKVALTIIETKGFDAENSTVEIKDNMAVFSKDENETLTIGPLSREDVNRIAKNKSLILAQVNKSGAFSSIFELNLN